MRGALNYLSRNIIAFWHIIVLVTTTNAQFLPFPGAGWNLWPPATTTSALPSQVVGQHTLQPYEITLPAGGGRLGFTGDGGVSIRNFGPQIYEIFKFWIEAGSTDVQIELGCNWGGTPVWSGPITTFTDGNTIVNGSWTAGRIPLNQFDNKLINFISLWTTGSNAVRVRLTGYAGNNDGTDTAALVTLETPPTDLVSWNFTSQGQGNGNGAPDLGLTCTFACANKPVRGASDLADVYVQAYRDTTDGPKVMTPGSTPVQDGVVKYTHIWGGPTSKAVAEYPNPFLACLCHTADYFIIGRRDQAIQNMTVWMPVTSEHAVHILTAYARFVKESRSPDGKDTVSILVRMRIPNSMGGSRGMPDYLWSQLVTPNCTAGNRRWLCPDHIIFQNTQLGALNLGLGRLQPITYENYQYFKRTGFDVAFDLHPMVDKLLYYSGEYYGIPAWLELEHWHFSTSSAQWLRNNNLQPPPPLGDWGSNWKATWNMTAFTNMAIKLNQDGGQANIIPFPANYDHTPYFQYMVFGWGATMLDTTGRCGLLADDSAERALNATFVKWLQYPTLMQERTIWNNSDADHERIKEWVLWKTQPPKDNPLDEDIWNMADFFPFPFPWPPFGPPNGFTIARPYDYGAFGLWKKIHPPQGVARISGTLIGISSTSKNATLAHNALMLGFAQNTAYKGNMALRADPNSDPTGFAAGYQSAFDTPDYQWIKTILQLDDQKLLSMGAFPGYPVQQSQSYGLVQTYDPMNLVFNEIQFKGDRVTVRDALGHACKIIDFLTLPPCTKDFLEVYVEDKPASNTGDLKFRWAPNTVNVTCRLGVAKAITDFPAPVTNAVTLTYTSVHTPQAKAMVALCVIGIIFELLLAFLFLFKSDKQVIKAASIKASLMIFLGACLTLSSVIMRVTGSTGNGWFQCWGTYYAFATGFGLVLGALALKSYRISYIFNSAKKTMNAAFTDTKLMASLMGIVLIEISLCVALEFGLEDSSTVRYLNLPGFNTTIEQQDCPTSHKGGVVTLYIWNVLLIIVAAYYAFKTRNVVAAFNENVFTSAAILLISVVTIVIVPVLQLITSSVAIFMLIALGTIIATLLSTAIFAIPKVLMAFELINVENVTQTLYKSAMMPGHAATGMDKGGNQYRTKTSTPDATSSDTRASTAKPPGNRMMPVGSVPIGSSIAQRQDSFDTARKGDSDSDV